MNSRRWFNILVPAVVLVAGILFVGNQASSSGPARVAYVAPAPGTQHVADSQTVQAEADLWQATALKAAASPNPGKTTAP